MSINTIEAPPAIHASAQWSALANVKKLVDPDVRVLVENTSSKTARRVELNCKVYDRSGILIAAPQGYLSEIGPHEAARITAYDNADGVVYRFACRITIGAWK
jgi:hypothetical protein